ncbi:MAG TPA: TRAM domain-containing protein [Gemmatimonadota bacterium]|nr:TRAM domain-containing protein [Gemmatimonadota bacterium]
MDRSPVSALGGPPDVRPGGDEADRAAVAEPREVGAPPAGPGAGDLVEVAVDRIAHGGDCVGRADGLVVFVPRTAPGDRARVRLTERHPRWARGRAEALIEPAELRVTPGCAIYDRCGGCQLQHLPIEAQRAAKADAVADALERIARRSPPGPVECRPAADPWHYRQRAVLTWRAAGARLALGFHDWDELAAVVPLVACPILDEAGNRALAGLAGGLVRALGLEDTAPPGTSVPRGEGPEGRLAVRVLPGGAVDAGVFAADAGTARRLAESCAEVSGLAVTWGLWRPPAPLALAPGAPRLETRFDYRGLTLRAGFDAFLQADLHAAERLYDAVLEALEPAPGDRVVDGYAGIGVVTAHLSAAGAVVTAVESHPGAASDLRANAAAAEAAGGAQVHVLEIPAERMDWAKPQPRAVVLNPPRGGCPPRALASIGRSTAERIVYVACDPATLARDVKRLGAAWRLDAVTAYDLFPQTAHVETVARLSRQRRRAA